MRPTSIMEARNVRGDLFHHACGGIEQPDAPRTCVPKACCKNRNRFSVIEKRFAHVRNRRASTRHCVVVGHKRRPGDGRDLRAKRRDVIFRLSETSPLGTGDAVECALGPCSTASARPSCVVISAGRQGDCPLTWCAASAKTYADFQLRFLPGRGAQRTATPIRARIVERDGQVKGIIEVPEHPGPAVGRGPAGAAPKADPPPPQWGAFQGAGPGVLSPISASWRNASPRCNESLGAGDDDPLEWESVGAGRGQAARRLLNWATGSFPVEGRGRVAVGETSSSTRARFEPFLQGRQATGFPTTCRAKRLPGPTWPKMLAADAHDVRPLPHRPPRALSCPSNTLPQLEENPESLRRPVPPTRWSNPRLEQWLNFLKSQPRRRAPAHGRRGPWRARWAASGRPSWCARRGRNQTSWGPPRGTIRAGVCKPAGH